MSPQLELALPAPVPTPLAALRARCTIDPRTGCWLFTGRRDRDGYGRIGDGGMAHRHTYTLGRGEIPAGLFVRHTCDRFYAPGDRTYRACCNPDHLEPGTHADNMRDMVERGRSLRGERNPSARFTVADVRSIRARHAAGERLVDLAREFGVTINATWSIAHGLTWSHVEPEAEAA